MKAVALEAEAGNLAKAAETVAPAVASLEEMKMRKIKFPCGMGDRENRGCLIAKPRPISRGGKNGAVFTE